MSSESTNSESTPRPDFYVTGGTVRPSSESYIVRQADEDLFQAALAGEFCYVLTTRQMGKSSLMARTAERLAVKGIRSVQVDLTLIGSDEASINSNQWYFGVAYRIIRELKLSEPLAAWWKEREPMPAVQRFTDFLESVVLGSSSERIVIFVDEIDSTIGLSFSDDFFAAIRACYNRRVTNPALERLAFILLGVATPAQLISDPSRTPFNIGRGIELTDFTTAEADVLTKGFDARGKDLLERILFWTGGHPYLTQALCRAVAEAEQRPESSAQTPHDLVDGLVQERFFSPMAAVEENNLKFVRGRLRQGYSDLRKLLMLYLRVLRGEPVRDRPASPVYASLKLAGVVKTDQEGFLKVRNRIYEHVFDRRWVVREMPTNTTRLVIAAGVVLLLLAAGFGYILLDQRAKPYVQTLASVPVEEDIAYTAYHALDSNLLYRHKAAFLLARYWEGREDRDRALLTLLRAIKQHDDPLYRRYAADLIGPDYEGLLATVRFGEGIQKIAISPDAKTIVTADAEGTLRLWNAQTGAPIGVPVQHDLLVDAIAFSPDSTKFVAVTYSTARVLKSDTGAPLSPPLNHENRVVAVAFSPDGKEVVTGGWDNTARLWNAETGKLLGSLKHDDWVTAVTFSPDGKKILTAADDHSAHLWNAETGTRIGSPMKHEDSIRAVAFSPDGKLVATASADHTARLWRADSGTAIAVLHHEEAVNVVVFSPDGKVIATGDDGGIARLWRADTGTAISPPLESYGSVLRMAFSPDGKKLLTGSAEYDARLWSAETGALLRSPLRTGGVVDAVGFSPDGTALLTAGVTTGARLWRSDPRVRLESPAPPWIKSRAGFSEDPKRVVSFDGNAARIWWAETWEPASPPLRHQAEVTTAAFSPNGKVVITGSKDRTAQLWRTDTGEVIGARMLHGDTIWRVGFTMDGKAALTGSKDGTARLWKPDTGEPLSKILRHGAHTGAEVYSVDANLNRNLAVTGGSDGIARLWEIDTGKELRDLQEQGNITVTVFSPNADFVLTGTNRGVEHLWRTNDGTQIGSWKHNSWAVGAAFSRDGRTVGFSVLGWYFVRSLNGQTFQLIAAGMWRDVGVEAISALRDGKNWEFEQTPLSGKGVVIVPAGQPVASPLAGDPQALLNDWTTRLSLNVDSQGRITSKYLPPSPAPQRETSKGSTKDAARKPAATSGNQP
jgi:WD40 repeat protein